MESLQTQPLLPFYFGPPGRRLFGCLHAPRRSRASSRGVVLCNTWGHEAIQFHRALGQLAQLLCAAGLAVLRFDALGCGDSEGSLEEASLASWREDVALAAGELCRRRPELEGVDLVGLRLGGALAAHVGARRLVLWDPVVRGADHLSELAGLHRLLLRDAHVRPLPDERPQLLGFALPPALAAELAQLDLAGLERPPAERVLLVRSHPSADPARLRARLAALGVALEERALPAPELWTWEEDFGKQLVPFKLLQSIVAWLA